MLKLNWRRAAEYLNDPCNIPAWIKYAARLRVLDHCCEDLPGSIHDPGMPQAVADRIRETFTLMGVTPPSPEQAMEAAKDSMVGIEYLGEIIERMCLLGDAEF